MPEGTCLVQHCKYSSDLQANSICIDFAGSVKLRTREISLYLSISGLGEG